MTVFDDALTAETRGGRHDTTTSHVVCADGTVAAAVDAGLIAAMLRAWLAEVRR